ncbi:MAG: FecR domain-containing protein [Chitinophagaceae bacterium]
MSQELFWVLFSKKLSGEASAEEMGLLENLIQQHPEWQYAIQNLEDLWKYQPYKDFVQEEDAYMLHLHRMAELNIPFGEVAIEAAIPAKGRNRLVTKWYWAAAAVIALVGLFAFGNLFNDEPERNPIAQQVNEITTRPGSKSKVQLPDGSVVWLNAGSKLTYNKDFGKEIREVTLTGEGFFDVAKNKEKPFVINTATISIKVLGTAFNVKAYPDDKQTEASLIRGSIEVTIRSRPNDKIILSPSEKLVVENNVPKADVREMRTGNIERTSLPVISTLISVNKLKYSPVDSTVAETQWVNNKLVFRNESFTELAVRMERWYDVAIDITDESIAEERLNGIFETETISQALDALKETIPFQYEKTGNKIIIHR